LYSIISVSLFIGIPSTVTTGKSVKSYALGLSYLQPANGLINSCVYLLYDTDVAKISGLGNFYTMSSQKVRWVYSSADTALG